MPLKLNYINNRRIDKLLSAFVLQKVKNNMTKQKDSLTFYYPTLIKTDSRNIETGIDTFKLNWYSSALYCANEPVLYNYYQGHDIYRFLWLRSFHRPVVFSLHKNYFNTISTPCKKTAS
ncbi:hypothetical protein FACS1894182_09410 [Bacteroidia bacterium]|nr:hypothetical protein FACS1894182_09410 [Bacteroidia bacterium]